MHVSYISHNFSPREQALIYIELMLHYFFFFGFVPASLCLCVNVCRKVVRRKMIKLRVVNLSVDKRRKQSTANNQQTRTFSNFSHNFFKKKKSDCSHLLIRVKRIKNRMSNICCMYTWAEWMKSKKIKSKSLTTNIIFGALFFLSFFIFLSLYVFFSSVVWCIYGRNDAARQFWKTFLWNLSLDT